MSLKDANKLTPSIHLARAINNLAPSDVIVDRLIVNSPEYMKTLTGIISNSTREVIQSYFLWKVIQAHAAEIEADEIKPYSRFVNELQGKVSSEYVSRVIQV